MNVVIPSSNELMESAHRQCTNRLNQIKQINQQGSDVKQPQQQIGKPMSNDDTSQLTSIITTPSYSKEQLTEQTSFLNQ